MMKYSINLLSFKFEEIIIGNHFSATAIGIREYITTTYDFDSILKFVLAWL